MINKKNDGACIMILLVDYLYIMKQPYFTLLSIFWHLMLNFTTLKISKSMKSLNFYRVAFYSLTSGQHQHNNNVWPYVPRRKYYTG